MGKYISRSLFIEGVGLHCSQPYGFHYTDDCISKEDMVHVVSQQTKGAASGKRLP